MGGDNETRMYELPVFGLISQTGKVKPSCVHLTSDKRGWHTVGGAEMAGFCVITGWDLVRSCMMVSLKLLAFLDLHVTNEQLFW